MNRLFFFCTISLVLFSGCTFSQESKVNSSQNDAKKQAIIDSLTKEIKIKENLIKQQNDNMIKVQTIIFDLNYIIQHYPISDFYSDKEVMTKIQKYIDNIKSNYNYIESFGNTGKIKIFIYSIEESIKTKSKNESFTDLNKLKNIFSELVFITQNLQTKDVAKNDSLKLKIKKSLIYIQSESDFITQFTTKNKLNEFLNSMKEYFSINY